MTIIGAASQNTWIYENLPKQGDPGRVAGALVFSGDRLVHSVRSYPYEMLELVTYSATGIGPAKLKTGLAIPHQAMDTPNWFILLSVKSAKRV